MVIARSASLRASVYRLALYKAADLLEWRARAVVVSVEGHV